MRRFESTTETPSFSRRVLSSFMPQVVGIIVVYALLFWLVGLNALQVASQSAYNNYLASVKALHAAAQVLSRPWDPNLSSDQQAITRSRWERLLRTFEASANERRQEFLLVALLDPQGKPVVQRGRYDLETVGSPHDEPVLRFQHNVGIVTLALGQAEPKGYIVAVFRNPWALRWLVFYVLSLGGGIFLGLYLLVATRFVDERLDASLRPLQRLTDAVRRFSDGTVEPDLPRPDPDWPQEFLALHRALNELAWHLHRARLETAHTLATTAGHRNVLLTLADILAQMSVQTTKVEFWQTMAPTLTSLIQAEALGFFALDKEGERLQPRYLHGLSPQTRRRLAQERRLQRAGARWAKAVMNSSQILVVEEIRDENPLQEWGAWIVQEGLHGVVALALHHRGRALGVLVLFFSNPLRLFDDDLHLLEIISRQVAAWLDTLHTTQAAQAARRRLAEQARQLAFMNTVITAINRATDLQDIIAIAYKHIVDWLPQDAYTLSAQASPLGIEHRVGVEISAEAQEALLRLARPEGQVSLSRGEAPPPVQAVMAEIGARYVHVLWGQEEDICVWAAIWHRQAEPLADEELLALTTAGYAILGGAARAISLSRVHQHLQREQRLSELLVTINETLDLGTVLDRVLAITGEVVTADVAVIGLIENHTVNDAYALGLPPELHDRRAQVAEGLLSSTLEQGPQVIADAEALAALDPAISSLQAHAAIAAPLRASHWACWSPSGVSRLGTLTRSTWRPWSASRTAQQPPSGTAACSQPCNGTWKSCRLSWSTNKGSLARWTWTKCWRASATVRCDCCPTPRTCTFTCTTA